MEIIRHPDITKDFKRLNRYLTPAQSLEAWERLLAIKGVNETPGIDLFPGFGENKIYKGRVVPLKENVGKSKGYRVIFQLMEGKFRILVFCRHGIYKTEKELIEMIKERLTT